MAMAMAISAAGAATRTANIALVPPQSLLARAHVQCTVIGAVWKQRSGPVSAQFCAAPRKPPLGNLRDQFTFLDSSSHLYHLEVLCGGRFTSDRYGLK